MLRFRWSHLLGLGLGLILIGNVRMLMSLDRVEGVKRDSLRVVVGVGVLSVALSPYEAVLGRSNPSPPHGSPAKGRISSRFGMRTHPITRRWKMHQGVDIAVPVGSTVMVTADGWVSRIGSDPNGWGLFLDIIHPASGYLTRYAHLSATKVQVGQPVRRGHVIALSGNSGNSTGPHLHYEIRTRHGRAINPLTLHASR